MEVSEAAEEPRPKTSARAAELEAIARNRWFTPLELWEILTQREELGLTLTTAPPQSPSSGVFLLFNKQQVKGFKMDGVNWVRKNREKRAREDHVKLRIGGVPSISGAYTHSADVPVSWHHLWSLSLAQRLTQRALLSLRRLFTDGCTALASLIFAWFITLMMPTLSLRKAD
jgi:hypothetical protein